MFFKFHPYHRCNFQVHDSVPTEDEIKWDMKWLQNHRSRVPSWMQVEHFKGWFAEARKEETPAAKSVATEGTVTGMVLGVGKREGRDRKEG